MPDLNITVQEVRGLAGTALVVLNGSIDAKTVITFQTHLNSVKERGVNRFILDMENVKYVNSTGLGYLINLSDSVNGDKGGISLVKVQPKVKVVFDMLGLNAFFKIYPTRDEAMKHFTSEPIASSTDQTVVLGSVQKAAGPPTTVAHGGGASLPEAPPRPAERPAPVAVRSPGPGPAPEAPHAPATGEVHLECRTCKAVLALREVGTYKCPRCFTLFNYVGGGKASFLPRRKEVPLQLSLNFSEEATRGLLEFVRLVAGRAGFVDGVLGDLTGAVRNTVDSIRDLAYGGNQDNVYHVMVAAGDSEIELRFADYGNSISPDRKGSDGKPAFAAVREAVDTFELKNHPKGGNVVTLAKKAR